MTPLPHVVILVGFRNRLLVLLQWAWAYLTRRRGARLITGDTPAELGLTANPKAGTGE